MNFDRTYELLGLFEEDSERKTYIGRENSTGREVFVHLLDGGSEPPLLAMAERYLISNPDAGSHLQIGTFQNQSCLITASGAQFRNIRRALEPGSTSDRFDKVRMWKVPVANESPAKPAAAPELGEFTRMFSNPAPAEPLPPSSAGEFTKIFTASKPSEPLTAESGPSSRSEQPSPSPGEFTRIFTPDKTPERSITESTASIGKGPLVPEKPASADGFTQMFSPAPAKSEPGDFTRMFRPDATPAPNTNTNWLDSSPPELNMSLSGSEGATGAFQVRSTPPPVSVPEEGPSEYTRMMSVPAALPKEENTASPPPAPAEPAGQKKSYLPLIIILNVLFILAVALVLIFLLRR